jgi:Rrf2 family protein
LYRVLRRLVDAGLLVGTSGPSGGYMLAKPPSAITLLDIVNAVESPPEASVLEPVRAKHRRPIAVINRLCRANAVRFKQDLAKTTLAKLRK